MPPPPLAPAPGLPAPEDAPAPAASGEPPAPLVKVPVPLAPATPPAQLPTQPVLPDRGVFWLGSSFDEQLATEPPSPNSKHANVAGW